VPDRQERVALEQRAHALEGPVQVVIVVHAHAPARRQPRLLVVDLPGVEVQDRRLAVAGEPSQPPAEDRRRQESQVRAAGERQAHGADVERGQRELADREAVAQAQLDGALVEVADAVAVVAHREDRGVEAEALLGEDLERPQRARRDREARRAIALDADTGCILDRGPGALQILAEALRPDFVDQLMGVAVTRDLVASCGNLAHQGALALGHPPQREEGGAAFRLLEEIEQAPRGIGYARGVRFPAAPLDQAVEVRDLEVLLEVHAQRVERHVRFP